MQLKYKGFTGSNEWSPGDLVCHGRIQKIPHTVSYEGKTLEEMEKAFQEAVDDYLEICKDKGMPTRMLEQLGK